MKLPKRNSKKYKEILKKGCGGSYNEWTGDYDCEYDYDWICDDCPLVTEQYYMKDKKNPYINRLNELKSRLEQVCYIAVSQGVISRMLCSHLLDINIADLDDWLETYHNTKIKEIDEQFITDFINKIEDLPPEYSKVVDENFWYLT